MSGTSKRVAICAAMMGLSIAMIGCDPDPVDPVDAGRDSGPPPTDGGQDAGEEMDAGPMEDGGQDAGPPPATLRLAHLIANTPGAPAAMGAVHLCLAASGSTTQLLITRNDAGAAPIPYGGVSPYTSALMLAPITYDVHVYEVADVTGTTCPAITEALFSAEVDASTLVGGSTYTIAAVGRIGSAEQPPGLVIIEDDNTDPAAGQTRLRIVHGVTGIPVNVDVCYDPDFSIGATGPVPGPEPAVAVATDVAYVGGATAVLELPYAERDPMADGALLVYVRAPAPIDCAAPDRAPNIPIPLPFPVPSGAGIPENITATIDADDVVTLFFRGDAPSGASVTAIPCPTGAECAGMAGAVCHPTAMVCVHPQGPTLTPWIDNLPPAAP